MTMTSTMSPTARLCYWVTSTHYEEISVEVRQETVTLLYDQVGCMLASKDGAHSSRLVSLP